MSIYNMLQTFIWSKCSTSIQNQDLLDRNENVEKYNYNSLCIPKSICFEKAETY